MRCQTPLKTLTDNVVEEPLRELVRGRLEASGPITATQLARLFQQPLSAVEQAILALENEGFALRGQFDPALPSDQEQWCERRLLARIHRYSRDRKRASIRPVSPQVFQRFVLRWHGLDQERPEGLDAILGAMEKLEGFSAPAQVWEQHILPARIALYLPNQLDSLCAAGKLTWARIVPKTSGGKGRGPVRNTPIAFAPRETLVCWLPENLGKDQELSSDAQNVLAELEQRGAAFFSDLAQRTGLLRAQLEAALGELVSAGRINADTFAGLRSLIAPSKAKPRGAPRTRRRQALFSGAQDAGRWSLLQTTAQDSDDVLEHLLWSMLMRYGVISRVMLEREAVRPPWRRLLQLAWRLEARGDIAGGRFVDGMSGEQFALPEAVDMLRKIESSKEQGELVRVNACDPAHLTGRILPGPKIAELAANAVVYRDGQLLGWLQRGEPETQRDLNEGERLQVLASLTGNAQYGQRGMPRRQSR